MWRVPMKDKEFKGVLSYMDCCPNQPVHGKAAHCTEATTNLEQSGMINYKI